KSVKPLLNSIIYNLVSNAIKYRSHDRDLHVSIRTSEDPDYWVLQVADNGLGIDMALYGKDLFKMYKRFHENHEGKGLGLYLVKLQVESLDGFIEVTSEVDIGTTFTIYFRKGEGSV
ncbi:MAG TPA: ATP-binding protein, partial [Chryseolinea sp.]|nr:ATP-binding protein [Chryseolinea sp.]